jgi:dTDP-glucose pyrophosphorylase
MSDLPLAADAALRDAVRAIEASRRRIAIVVDAGGRLAGTLTDGDIRRALLAGCSLDDPVASAMNRQPIRAAASSPDAYILELLVNRNLEALPLVDVDGRYVRVVHRSDLDPASAPAGGRVSPAECGGAVIMAGGEGQRLRPLTETLPKPMIEIGGMPLIERLVRSLVRHGIRRIHVSTNYLRHLIEEHLGDGARFGAEIAYLREPRKLGTAGALSLLPERPALPLLVMNGDVLTNSGYDNLLHFHREHRSAVTVAAVEHRIEIPYGVLQAEGTRVTGLQEKPAQRFLCNAGLYVVEPAALDLVPRDRAFDMPELMERCLAEGLAVSVFPLHEYWTDICTPADLAKARVAVERWETALG